MNKEKILFYKILIYRCTLKPLKRLKYKAFDFFWIKKQFSGARLNEKRIFLVGTPEHRNFGDQAIAQAEIEFLKDYFPERDAVEITLPRFMRLRGFLKSNVKAADLILLHGGGYMGNLWMEGEIMFREALRCFSDNKVVAFPNTVFFQKIANWENELEETKKAYREHKNLTVFIRDESFEYMVNEICGAADICVLNTPDIVLYLNESKTKLERKNVTFVMRGDHEKTTSDDLVKTLVSHVEKYGYSCRYSSMIAASKPDISKRETFLQGKFDEFRSSKLVITDRLHGMIFSAVTGTPCIAFNNSSKKVQGVWNLWLRGIPYVKFVNSEEEAIALMREMLNLPEQNYDNSMFKEQWDRIASIVKESL